MTLFLSMLLLIKVSLNDLKHRTVKHSDLVWLAVLLLLGWFFMPNWQVLSYSLMIIVIGFILFVFRILGAGDTKLLAIVSLGVHPAIMPLMLFGVIILGGLLAISYLVYGCFTDWHTLRERGIPYTIPISISGGICIALSYLSWFGVNF